MNLRSFFVAAALVVGLSNSFGTSPCRERGGCIDEASASFLAPIDVLERRCVESVPAKARAYREVARRLLRGEDHDFLQRLRDSDVYRNVRKDVEAEFDKMERQAILKVCDAWLQAT